MKRRTLLGSVAGLGAGMLAGCTGLQGSQALFNPDISRDDSEVVMAFGEAGNHVARSTIMYDGNPPGSEMVASLKLRMWHREGTTVDTLQVRLRDAVPGPEPPPSVFLAVPENTGFPEVNLYTTTDGSARVIEIPDLGELGGGTFGLDFFVVPHTDRRPVPVWLSMDARLTEEGVLGSEYSLEGTTDIEIPMD